MTTVKEIQSYVGTISRGVVNLSEEQAWVIVTLVTGVKVRTGPYCKLCRYNAQLGKWDAIRIARSTDAEIDKAIREALESKPVEYCYRWECYNSAGEFQGNIYSVNPMLF